MDAGPSNDARTAAGRDYLRRLVNHECLDREAESENTCYVRLRARPHHTGEGNYRRPLDGSEVGDGWLTGSRFSQTRRSLISVTAKPDELHFSRHSTHSGVAKGKRFTPPKIDKIGLNCC